MLVNMDLKINILLRVLTGDNLTITHILGSIDQRQVSEFGIGQVTQETFLVDGSYPQQQPDINST